MSRSQTFDHAAEPLCAFRAERASEIACLTASIADGFPSSSRSASSSSRCETRTTWNCSGAFTARGSLSDKLAHDFRDVLALARQVSSDLGEQAALRR